MKRYIKGPNSGGSSKASASTLCQKCLKKGHYSYECKAPAQERPYVSRPSRTQQLLNPKLVPKLSSEVPQDLLRKKGIADEQLAKLEEERGRKRDKQDEEPAEGNTSKRFRSPSFSSVSVSTISTRSSSSSDIRVRKILASEKNRENSRMRRNSSYPRNKLMNGANLPSQRRGFPLTDRKRDRQSSSSSASYSSDYDRSSSRKSTRRRYRSVSPPMRGRTAKGKSPFSLQKHNRSEVVDTNITHRDNSVPKENERISPMREKSLSPFSKRLALTQAMNMNR
ncbi:hypothetical protein GcM1_250280 [Golovinomyces cichoracearum]|uniref:Zinc knuckle protein n=1 Tax=Golovinomyces cichoracearum TaxID=62708 RepID=A0A420IBE3_9PEZI|nr:hypothetical protein GcM1_250280 [Golovinomyces cichoracearum]